MQQLNLTKTEDLAKAGILIANGHEPSSGVNFITDDNEREFYVYFPDSCKNLLKNIENSREFRAAYMALIFADEARKQIPLTSIKLSNGKEILLPINTPQSEVERLIHSL